MSINSINNHNNSKLVDVGILLRKRRSDLNLSLQDLSSKLLLSSDVIKSIEDGAFLNAYNRDLQKFNHYGLILIYAQALNLNHNEILSYIKEETSFLVKENTISYLKRKKNSSINIKAILSLRRILYYFILLATLHFFSLQLKPKNHLDLAQIDDYIQF